MFPNHSEIIVLYEASRECAWLHRVIDHIHTSYGMGIVESPTIIYEDNVACVAQMQTWYIKNNYTKHISLKLFYPYELQENWEIRILQIKYCNNHTNLFIKSLPLTIFYKCVKDIGMKRFKDMQGLGREPLWMILLKCIILYSLWVLREFLMKSFLMRQYAHKYMSISWFFL
jgi:hypothetical protein